MRRFAAIVAGVVLALSGLTMSATAANADLIVLPDPPVNFAPPPGPPPLVGTWTFTANYLSSQDCTKAGAQYVKLVPQDRLARCETTTAHPGIWDLWLLYAEPHTGK